MTTYLLAYTQLGVNVCCPDVTCWGDMPGVYGLWVQHGSNPEARRFFSGMIVGQSVRDIEDWLREAHDHEVAT